MKPIIKPVFKKTLLVLLLLVVGFSLLWFLRAKPAPKVVTTTPSNNQEGVALTDDVSIVFDHELNDGEKNNLKIRIAPDTTYDTIWDKENLRLAFKNDLKQATKYGVALWYKSKIIYSLTFETLLLTEEQLKTEGAKQTADDLAFGNAYKLFIEKYPWYQRLPIERKEYRIVYDFETKSFRIRILVPVENKEQETSFINAALKDIEAIGYKGVPSYYVLKD